MALLLFLLVFSIGLFMPRFCQGEPKAGHGGFETHGALLFHSGFEPESRIENQGDPSASSVKIVGKDRSVSAPNDWVADIDNNPHMGRFSLQYHHGDISMRYARIIPEPGNPDNHVLHFWMNQPSAGTRSNARIQANIYASGREPVTGIKALYQTVRLFLHEDMEVVKRYPHPQYQGPRAGWYHALESDEVVHIKGIDRFCQGRRQGATGLLG